MTGIDENNMNENNESQRIDLESLLEYDRIEELYRELSRDWYCENDINND